MPKNAFLSAALTGGLAAAGTVNADVVRIGINDRDMVDVIGIDHVRPIDNPLLGVIEVDALGPITPVDALFESDWTEAKKKKRKVKGIKGGKGIKNPKPRKPQPSTPTTCCGLDSTDDVFGWHLDDDSDLVLTELDNALLPRDDEETGSK